MLRETSLFFLPDYIGGLGLTKQKETAAHEFTSSQKSLLLLAPSNSNAQRLKSSDLDNKNSHTATDYTTKAPPARNLSACPSYPLKSMDLHCIKGHLEMPCVFGANGGQPTYPTIVSATIPSQLIMLSVAPLEASQP